MSNFSINRFNKMSGEKDKTTSSTAPEKEPAQLESERKPNRIQRNRRLGKQQLIINRSGATMPQNSGGSEYLGNGAEMQPTLMDALKRAREHFHDGQPLSANGYPFGLEEFFINQGFSIRMPMGIAPTHSNGGKTSSNPNGCPSKEDFPSISAAQKDGAASSSAASSSAAAGDPVPIEVKSEDVTRPDIRGLFVVDDPNIPTSGFVIDAMDNFKILVHPLPDVINTTTALRFCLNNLRDYNIYRALDGTRVTLYYVERLKTWLLATTNSYDAREYKWIGPKTYMTILMECIHAQNSEFSLDSLDKSSQYALIFRHHDFHPLLKDPQGVWQLTGPAIPGVTPYVPLTADEIPAGGGEALRQLAQHAFVDYARGGVINYGYIFRHKDASVNNDYGRGPAAVYLESSLHEFIRKHMYDIPKTIGGLTYENRAIYLHLRGYMVFGSNHAHLMMFPQAAEIYDKMDFVINLLTDMTVAEMRAKQASSAGGILHSIKKNTISDERSAIGHKLFGDAWAHVLEYMVQISQSISSCLITKGVIGPFGDHIHSNIRDQYLNIVNIQDFFKILTMK